jgi:hypothetical protein
VRTFDSKLIVKPPLTGESTKKNEIFTEISDCILIGSTGTPKAAGSLILMSNLGNTEKRKKFATKGRNMLLDELV